MANCSSASTTASVGRIWRGRIGVERGTASSIDGFGSISQAGGRFVWERGDFDEYGGPIGWVDGQLFGIGFASTRAPSLRTEVHVAGIRLVTSPVTASADRDLLRLARRVIDIRRCAS